MNDINNWQTNFVNCCYSDRLLNKLSSINKQKNTKDKINLLEIKKAIYYAKKYHGAQKRQSGELFYSHSLEVAYMVADYCCKTDILITSILHDTIEDTRLTREMIDNIFTPDIGDLVESLTRAWPGKKINISIEELIQLLFKHKNRDELLLIKYFDRVHNIQTIQAKSLEKILKSIKETLDNFINVELHLKIAFPNLSSNNNDIAKLCYQHTPRNLIKTFTYKNLNACSKTLQTSC